MASAGVIMSHSRYSSTSSSLLRKSQYKVLHVLLPLQAAIDFLLGAGAHQLHDLRRPYLSGAMDTLIALLVMLRLICRSIPDSDTCCNKLVNAVRNCSWVEEEYS